MDFFDALLMDIKTLIGTKHFILLGHFTCCSSGWVSFVYIVDGYEILSFQHAVGNLIWWGFQSKFAECNLFCFETFLSIETTSLFEMCVTAYFFQRFKHELKTCYNSITFMLSVNPIPVLECSRFGRNLNFSIFNFCKSFVLWHCWYSNVSQCGSVTELV